MKVVIHLLDGSAETFKNADLIYVGAWIVVIQEPGLMDSPRHLVPANRVSHVDAQRDD